MFFVNTTTLPEISVRSLPPAQPLLIILADAMQRGADYQNIDQYRNKNRRSYNRWIYSVNA